MAETNQKRWFRLSTPVLGLWVGLGSIWEALSNPSPLLEAEEVAPHIAESGRYQGTLTTATAGRRAQGTGQRELGE